MKAAYALVPARRIIPMILLVMSVLFSTLNAQAQPAGATSLSGWLSIVRGDSRDGSQTNELIILSTEAGDSIQLSLDGQAAEAQGGLLALDRKHITVRGDWSTGPRAQSGPPTFQVTSIDPLPQADAASAAVTGTQKWVSILCKFQGVAAEPKNLAYFQNMYSNTFPGLDHYWREQSYNLINTVGSTAVGWFVLPHPHSYYMSGARFNLDLAARDCTGVADASVNFAGINGINLMFNAELDNYAWGGGSYLTLDGITKVWNMTWEPPWGYDNIGVLGHEMGHAFGLPHSSGNYGQTYDNEWDVMSDHWSGCYYRGGQDPVYKCYGQHTISYHKDILGWIPAAQKRIVNAGSAATLTLEQLALPQTGNYKIVRIPIAGSNSRFYTLEARRRTGYDAQLAGNAVVIHDVDTSRSGSPARVIDIDNNTITGDAGAMWTTGEVFRNNTYKIAVAVLGATDSGFRVHVASNANMYYISGNLGTGGVTVNYTGGSTVTDSTGRYVIPVPAGWSGTIRPVKTSFVFSPATRTYNNVTADQFNQNYTVAQSFTISGNAVVSGATLSYTAGTPRTVLTQPNGNYALSVPGGWSGLVIPSHPCFSFNPGNRGYTSVGTSLTSQNYAVSFNSGSGCADINAWIGGVNRGRFGLPAGASTRTSFAGLDSGPVRLVSNNAVPIIAAERLIHKANGVDVSFTEMLALPESLLDTTYYLPWYNNKDLNTQLRFANVSDSTATVHVSIGGIEMADSPYTLAPGASLRRSYANVDSGPVQIESNVPIVAAERVIYRVNGVDTSFTEMMAMPAGQLDTTYYLPWYNNKDLDTQLRFANVGNTPATVHVYIGGTEMIDSPYVLAAGSSMRKSFPDIDQGPVKIESNVPIVAAERLIYRVNGVPTSFSETMALPGILLDDVFWLPWYNNVELNTQLRFAVP